MIKTTLWRPDTCDCVISYSWDSEMPEDDRVHTVTTVHNACVHHKNIEKTEHFNKVVGENTSKNKVYGVLLENFPELTEEDEQGNKRLKKGIEYKWSFDADRKLNVDIVGAQVSKASLRSFVEAEIGTDKLRLK